MANSGTAAIPLATVDTTMFDALPPQGKFSDEDYLKLTDTSNRPLELTDGHIQELPVPTYTHHAILGFLYDRFKEVVKPLGGIVVFAGLRMRVREGKFREPDLLVLLDRTDPRFQDRYWFGADLVVEVVSPDNPDRDYVTKRLDYAEVRIPEYWIVDPQQETITVLKLAPSPLFADRIRIETGEPAYIEHGVFSRGHPATSALLDRLLVEVDSVFDAPTTTE